MVDATGKIVREAKVASEEARGKIILAGRVVNVYPSPFNGS
jgi:hypothetical protein